jgi:hypothetical protein
VGRWHEGYSAMSARQPLVTAAADGLHNRRFDSRE